MKRCPKCQTYYTDEDKFCKKCGAMLEDVPEAPKNKSKKPVLIAALCALFAVGLLIGLLVGSSGGESKKEETKQTQQDDKKEKSGSKDKKEAAKDLKDKISKGDDKQDDKKDDKKAGGENFYEAEWCSFSYPEEWVGKVKIEENVYEKMRCISIYMKGGEEYGGLLYQIDLSDYPFSEDTSSDNVYYNPGYMETLDVSTTGVYAHLTHPTDVQFAPEKQEEYQALYNQDLSIIRDTFEFNY